MKKILLILLTGLVGYNTIQADSDICAIQYSQSSIDDLADLDNPSIMDELDKWFNGDQRHTRQ